MIFFLFFHSPLFFFVAKTAAGAAAVFAFSFTG